MEPTHTTVTRKSDVDGGWAWMVLFGCFFTIAILLGQIYSFSGYFVVFLQLFQESRSYTAWIGSLSLGVFQSAAISAGILIPLLGSRGTTVLGGFVAALGFFISSFATNVLYLIVSYGIVVAFGLSASFYGTLEALSQNFQRYLFIAMGLAMSGGGVGLMIFPYLLQWMLEAFGWRGALLLQAGLSLNICVCGALYFPMNTASHQPMKSLDSPISTKGKSQNDTSIVVSTASTYTEHEKRPVLMTWRQRFKEPRIAILALANLLQGVGILTLYVIYKDFAIFSNFGHVFPSTMLALGIGNIFGRFLTGVITSHMCPILYFVVVSALCTLVLFLDYVNHIAEVFVVLGAIFGYGHGSASSGLPLVVARLFGRHEVAVTLGFLMFFSGIGTLFGSPLAGYLVDQTGSYFGCFVLSGSFLAGSTCLYAIVFVMNSRRLVKGEQDSDQNTKNGCKTQNECVSPIEA